MMSATYACLALLFAVALAIACPVILVQRFLIRAQRRMLVEAGKEISERDITVQECGRVRDACRAALERVRAQRLDELADAVRALIAFLNARARELDQQDDWWKHGRDSNDEEGEAS